MSVITKIFNANVYLNGDNYAGLAEEVTAPEVKPKTSEHKALSNIGVFELPTGLDKMSMKIKWNTVNPAVMATTADFYNASDIMIRSHIDKYENGSKVGSSSVVMHVRGMSSGLPPVAFKHQDNPDMENTFNVTGYKLEIDGVTVVHVDFFANIYIVDGVDLLADYRANLGL